MTFEEAIKASIRQYYKGFQPEASLSLGELSTEYTPEYFDDVEQDMFGEVESDEEEEQQEVLEDA
jgi:hypothetical protein